MSSDFLRRTADVLEKLAEQMDDQHVQQQEAVQAERRKTAETLGEKIASVTGEDVSPAVLERIVDSDEDVVQAFMKLAEQHVAGPPDEMGEGVQPDDSNTRKPRTKTAQTKEAAAHADKQLLDWIMS